MLKKEKKGFVLQDVLFLFLGIFATSFGIKGFLVPNHFLDGGITGFALLMHEIFSLHLGLILLLFNLPFILISYKMIGKLFALRSLAAVIGVAICLQYIHFPEITHDKLLVAAFGGFFVGLGIGLSMRGGGTFDGIEVLAIFTVKRTGFSISEIILGFDILMFLIAAFYFNIETALYAMLTYFVASQTIRYVINGIQAYTGVTIISGESEAIKEFLVLKMNKGITIYKGERGFMKDSYEISSECDVVFTVVTRLEVRRLRNGIHRIDPKAFVFTNTIKETSGGIVKQIVKH